MPRWHQTLQNEYPEDSAPQIMDFSFIYMENGKDQPVCPIQERKATTDMLYIINKWTEAAQLLVPEQGLY